MNGDMRKRILDQQPNYSFGNSAPIQGDVRSAALSLTSAEAIDDFKVLAYALYVGALDESEVRERIAPESVQAVLTHLLSLLSGVSPKEITDAMPGYYAGFVGRLVGRSAEEGWALAVIEMLHKCLPETLDAVFENPDPVVFDASMDARDGMGTPDDSAGRRRLDPRQRCRPCRCGGRALLEDYRVED